jgi:hypothetical protein
MVAIINTNNAAQTAALKALAEIENFKITWYDSAEEADDAEDALLYYAMMEGDSEIIPIEEVKQMLKDKINARNIKPQFQRKHPKI